MWPSPVAEPGGHHKVAVMDIDTPEQLSLPQFVLPNSGMFRNLQAAVSLEGEVSLGSGASSLPPMG